MSKSLVSLCLLRIIYPICLTTCISCRQDLITAVYLLFLLYIPFVPLPTPRTMKGHTAIFLKLSFIVSVLMLILQIGFQIFLVSFDTYYGHMLQPNCSNKEEIFRHIGFIRYDSLSLWNCILHIAPEVIALFASFFVYISCDRLNPKSRDTDSAEQGLLISIIHSSDGSDNTQRSLVQRKALIAIAVIGKYLCLVMLCGASILVPSITTGVLYIIFLCSVSYWACYKDLEKGFAILCRFTCIIIFFYLFAIFFYQSQYIQDLIKPESRIPRYFGLQALHLTNCSTDPRDYVLNSNLQWPSFALPYALILLYYLLICESKILLFFAEYLKKQPEGMTRQIKSTRLSQKGQKSSLFRNKTNRWRIATCQELKRRFIETTMIENPNEMTPLIRGRESLYRRPDHSAVSQDSHGSITVSNAQDEKSYRTIEEMNETEDSLKVDIMEYLIDAFITVVSFITRTSYIGTNIIMMTWSITYHSWLTFFLLLGAIILWMVPNQRQSMLRLSPFFIVYAEFLLISQFIFGMDLTKDELLPQFDKLDEIGFTRTNFPVRPLAIKTLFTTMFWITMRQYMRERQESRSTSTVAHMMAPVHVTVGTATAMGGDPTSKGGQIIQKFGERVRKLLTKFWIWVVTITLFAIGITGSKMTLFRIIYTALALIFIITFQLSWVIWRKMMYGFWLTVIIISMIILVMIYTFQFDEVLELWEKIGVDAKWQQYIGLEKKDTGELFFFLIIPTFFVIITVIQLKYFHKDFLLISDIKSRGTSTTRPKSRPSIMSDDEYATQIEEVSSKTDTSPDEVQSPESSKTLVEQSENNVLQPSRPSFHVFGHAPNIETLQTLDKIKSFIKSIIEVGWLFMELHIRKFILILVVVVSVSEVNVIHFGFIVGAVLAMMLNSNFQDIVIRLMSVSAAVVLLLEMIFQIDHFSRNQWVVNCTVNNNNNNSSYKDASTNFTRPDLNYTQPIDKSSAFEQQIFSSNSTIRPIYGTDWLGFYKAGENSMLQLLSGYIWIILAVTIYVVVITRQKYVRHLKGRPLSRSRILFPRISYKDANKGVLCCIKYLFNYGFFRFGVEITFICIVMLIGIRLDLCALVYAVWLLLLVICARSTLAKIWYFFNWFVAVTIPLQYAIIVGLPPQFCFDTIYTSKTELIQALQWMFLPVNEFKPNAHKLFWDFMVLLFVTRQTKVFRIENQHKDNDYSGGSNKSIVHEMENPNYVNPIPDFISDKKSYLDIIKHGVLCSLLWISCAVLFLAGTYSVTLFSFGYVIGSFLILWQGNDFYLKPISSINMWWSRLLIYNVGVIFFKAFFQIPGCIFLHDMTENACWIVQLLGIACINTFAFPNTLLGNSIVDPKKTQTCLVPDEPVGMGWDALCFILLIFQKRLFSSHYFVRIVDEAKAMAVLAARGAELIEELSKKQIQKQQELEKAVLQKIKNKMDSIKAAQKKIQGIKSKELTSHQEERRAPLARETSPSISSTVSQQGFHTPIEEDLPTTTSRPNSYLQPPTPTSAIMTVSLEGYLEPQRISYGSPPMSHRPFSFDGDTCQPFSPPPFGFFSTHRRQSSFGFYTGHWYPNASIRRRSMSISSHHTSIRSGDYYMFDDEETNHLIEVDDELDAVEEADEDLQGKSLGKLMENVMKTDLKHAIESTRKSDVTDSKSTSSKRKSESFSKTTVSSGDDEDDNVEDDKECSSCQYKSTDATTSKDVTESIDDSGSVLVRRRKTSGKKKSSKTEDKRERDRKDKEKDDSTDSHKGSEASNDTESNAVVRCWDSFITYVKFALTFVNSCMVSMIQFLNRKSRDYRYVIQALEKEKKTLKETKNLRVGMRILPDMKWQPIPAGIPSQSKSPLKIEDFESQGLTASDQPVFVRLLLAFYHALMSHSDMVCYFAVFMLQIKSPTLASLPLSLMVFFWGTLSIPRPTKRFWVTIIAYAEFVVVVKSICQSEFFPFNREALDNKPFHWIRMLGIEKNTNDNYYALYDLILLLAVFFHRSTLKSLGLWKSAEEFNKDNKANTLLDLNYVEPQRISVISGSDSEVVTEMTTVNLTIPENFPSDEVVRYDPDSYQNAAHHGTKLTSRSLSVSKGNIFESFVKSIYDFFNKLMDSKSRIADDVYAYMFFCDFCNIIVIIFGFSAFGALKGDGGVTQYIEDNKIPFAFLAMIILQFALIVVDRWLYLSKYIVGKLVFQYLLVIGVHLWMFFILPAVTERQFNAALPPSLWYLIKCFYLLLSAYQIRSGYPSRILGNFLCKNYNLVNMVLFKIFMLIPFVYELRTLMDWIWTETSMTFADWVKMEDIFAQIFQLKCMRRAESKYPLPRSQKIAAKTKFLYGAGGLITLFTIIWFPLVLFALGDTVGEPNRPFDMVAKVQIGSYQPIYISTTSKIYSLTQDQWDRIKDQYRHSASAQTFLSDYYPEDVGVVILPHYSSSTWTIPPPEKKDLVKELNSSSCNQMRVIMEWTLNRRSENPESPKTVTESNTVYMDENMCRDFLNVLQFETNSSVTIKQLMPKFLKVTSPGKANPVDQLMRTEDKSDSDDVDVEIISPYVNLTFQLETGSSSTGVWWNVEERSKEKFLINIDSLINVENQIKPLIIYTFNDKMFPPGLLSLISGKGIIGLYTTFVIVVGTFVKGYFSGTFNKIMFEDMPYVDRILQLCLDIFLVRERREFDLEEDLFAKLLFLFRSPETMIKWTRPPEDSGSDDY